MKYLTMMAAGAAMLTTPAIADDWSGFYAGIHSGSSTGTYTQILSSADMIGADVDVDGLITGVTAGYNWNGGTFVYGIEADYSTGPSGVTPEGTRGPDLGCGSGDCIVSIDNFITVRGRVGIETNGVLVYGTAGYATGNVTGGIEGFPGIAGGDASGWAAGLGAEFTVFANTTAKAEILHVDLGTIPLGLYKGLDFEGIGSLDVVRFGLNYQF